MQQIVRLTPESELRSILTETFINNSGGKVTKISDNSVLSGIVSGEARVQKKALKDIALAVSHLFVDTASGSSLDTIASNYGIASRLGPSQSSTYIRVSGSPGTVYTQGVNTVTGNQGITFDLQESKTLDNFGYTYIKVRSQQTGSITNVDPYTLNTISPIPSGHVACINEYAATGGRDVESDDVFRQRIKEGPDILSRGTLSYLTQAAITINSNVLKVNYEGINSLGKCVLSVLTQNGIDLTSSELTALTTGLAPFLSLLDLNQIGSQSYGITLKNATYFPIDISFRCSLLDNYTIDTVAKNLQINLSKYVDFRFWDSSVNFVDAATLLQIARTTQGFSYIPDYYFSPSVDIHPPVNQYPRFRGFIIYDLSGNLILNQSGTLSSILYPNEVVNNLVISVF